MPSYCGSCVPYKEGEGTADACLCGCGYFNGWTQGVLAQFFFIAGFLFSCTVVVDCSFVQMENSILLPDFERPGSIQEAYIPDSTLELGLVTFANPNGECYFYNEGFDANKQIEWYVNQLTRNWHVARAFAGIGVTLGSWMLLYSTSLTCSAQVRPIRYTVAFICTIILATSQGMTFLLFATDFCDDNGCTFSRTAGFCVAATFSYFIAGLCFAQMKDFPGELGLSYAKQKIAQEAQKNAAPIAQSSKIDETDVKTEADFKGKDDNQGGEPPADVENQDGDEIVSS